MSIGSLIGGAINILPPVLNAIGGAVGVTPKLEDEVTVEVVGQPGSSKKELYYLALNTAFGLVRRFDASPTLAMPPGLLMLEYDAADSWVRCVLKYKSSILTSSLSKSTPTIPEMQIFKGPEEQVIGGAFNFTTKIQTPDRPTPYPGVPILPFTGKVILTTATTIQNGISTTPGAINASPAGNPRPPGDDISRGAVGNPGQVISASGTPFDAANPLNPIADIKATYLVPLVFAALSAPGTPNGMLFNTKESP